MWICKKKLIECNNKKKIAIKNKINNRDDKEIQ